MRGKIEGQLEKRRKRPSGPTEKQVDLSLLASSEDHQPHPDDHQQHFLFYRSNENEGNIHSYRVFSIRLSKTIGENRCSLRLSLIFCYLVYLSFIPSTLFVNPILSKDISLRIHRLFFSFSTCNFEILFVLF